MKSLLQKIRFLKTFSRLVRDPDDTAAIFQLSEHLLKNPNEEAMAPVLEKVFQDTQFSELYRSRYMPALPSLEALNAMPEGSLGKTCAQHLMKAHLTVEFYPAVDVKTPMAYLVLRLRQTHDLFHVLTGFGTDLQGELALQAFVVAQTASGFSGLLLVAGLLHVMGRKPREFLTTMRSIVEGFRLGERSDFLLGVRWEEKLGEPLEALRSLAGIPLADTPVFEATTSATA